MKRLLRAGRQKWKRGRRSLKKQRDEALFRLAQTELKDLREQLRSGICEFEVWYFDEAGFSLSGVLAVCVAGDWRAHRIGESGQSGQAAKCVGIFAEGSEKFV